MADSRVDKWVELLAPFKDRVRSALEIGSYEGQSAMFWLDYFPGVELMCIDMWCYYTSGCVSLMEVEEHFDINVGDRVTKIKDDSAQALLRLVFEGARFDLIYIDGDHSRDAVMLDSILSWPLLNPGGVMIWDDYASYDPAGKPERRPQPAIDKFVAMMAGKLSVLANTQEQLLVVKR